MIARNGFALFALLGSALPLAAEPFHHANGEWREYNRDWLAACPDAIDDDATDYYGFSCFASTGSQLLNRAGLPAYKITIFHNRLNGERDVAVTVAADGIAIDTSRPMIIVFGGEAAERFDFTADLEIRYETANRFFVVDPARKQALLDKMMKRNGAMITVPVTGGETRPVWLSMRGVSASIDFMAAYARKVAQY